MDPVPSLPRHRLRRGERWRTVYAVELVRLRNGDGTGWI